MKQKPRLDVLALQHGARSPWVSHLTHLLSFSTYTLTVKFENYKSQRITMIYVAGNNTFIQLRKRAIGRNLVPNLLYVSKGEKKKNHLLNYQFFLKNPCCMYYTPHTQKYTCNLTRPG